jgi:hypothetical protein
LGDACDCNDSICTTGTDINGDTICSPEELACDITPPTVTITTTGTADCAINNFVSEALVDITASDGSGNSEPESVCTSYIDPGSLEVPRCSMIGGQISD